jgi:hypothetical protein
MLTFEALKRRLGSYVKNTNNHPLACFSPDFFTEPFEAILKTQWAET